MRFASQCAVSCSCLTLLASPGSAGGDHGRAHGVYHGAYCTCGVSRTSCLYHKLGTYIFDSLTCFAVYDHLRCAFLASVSGLFLARRSTFSLASSAIVPAGLVCTGQGLVYARGVVHACGESRNIHK